MDRDRLTQSIKLHEGYRALPYRDSEGFWTIGYGHLIENVPLNGWMPHATLGSFLNTLCSREQHEMWLVSDVSSAITLSRAWIPSYELLSDIRQEVLAEMCFQMGGRVYGFKKFKAAVEIQDFEEASRQMIDSKWCEQTPARAKILANRFS